MTGVAPEEETEPRRVQLPALDVRGLSKKFGGRTVLDEVDLCVMPGEVHGLLGQNGSGKSTLIKILAGVHAPEPGGSISVGGERLSLPVAPDTARSMGIAFVHQDLGLAETMTVTENFKVGGYRTGFGWCVRWGRERRAVSEALARYGVAVSPDALVGDLPDAQRAMLAIVRAISQIESSSTRVLVLDEVTAYLPADDIAQLMKTVASVREAGFGVLVVSHRMDEIRSMTDRVTILRDGVVADCCPTRDLSEDDLIERIIGRSLGELYPSAVAKTGSTALALEGVSGPTVRDLTLRLSRGEVLGLAGLVDMGHDEAAHLIFGSVPAATGTIRIGTGESQPLRELTPRRAIRSGLALLPGNRLRDGGVMAASVAENITVTVLGRYFRGPWIRRREERGSVQRVLDDLDVRPPEAGRALATLSGGNQQKALVGKWLLTDPDVLILDEPARGVDVAARQQIFHRIRDVAQAGMAVVVASADHEDLAHLCDRVLVFRNGRVAASLSGAELTAERILQQALLSDDGREAASVAS